LISNGANVLVFAPIDAAGIVPAVKRANDAHALVFSIDDGPVIQTPVGPQYQLNATLVTGANVNAPDLWGNQVGK